MQSAPNRSANIHIPKSNIICKLINQSFTHTAYKLAAQLRGAYQGSARLWYIVISGRARTKYLQSPVYARTTYTSIWLWCLFVGMVSLGAHKSRIIYTTDRARVHKTSYRHRRHSISRVPDKPTQIHAGGRGERMNAVRRDASAEGFVRAMYVCVCVGEWSPFQGGFGEPWTCIQPSTTNAIYILYTWRCLLWLCLLARLDGTQNTHKVLGALYTHIHSNNFRLTPYIRRTAHIPTLLAHTNRSAPWMRRHDELIGGGRECGGRCCFVSTMLPNPPWCRPIAKKDQRTNPQGLHTLVILSAMYKRDITNTTQRIASTSYYTTTTSTTCWLAARAVFALCHSV